MTVLSFQDARRAKIEAKNRAYFQELREDVALCGHVIKYSRNPKAVAEAWVMLTEIRDELADVQRCGEDDTLERLFTEYNKLAE